jgi:hypothetical protein
MLDVRVPTSRALGLRQRVETRPAPTADDAALVSGEWTLADDTHTRQEEIGDAGRRTEPSA